MLVFAFLLVSTQACGMGPAIPFQALFEKRRHVAILFLSIPQNGVAKTILSPGMAQLSHSVPLITAENYLFW